MKKWKLKLENQQQESENYKDKQIKFHEIEIINLKTNHQSEIAELQLQNRDLISQCENLKCAIKEFQIQQSKMKQSVKLKKDNANIPTISQLAKYKSKITLSGHTGGINSIIQLKNGKIASGSGDNSIKIWDLSTNTCESTLTGHTENVMAVIELQDGRLVSSSWDKTIKCGGESLVQITRITVNSTT